MRSSAFGIFVVLAISTSTAYAQAHKTNQQTVKSNEFPAAQVGIVKATYASTYSFRIIHEIPEWKAERLEERMLLRYPDLKGIEIDANRNAVIMKVLNSTDDKTLTEIFSHFKYNGYEEL
ncbi:MAG: hypothetical protein P8P74_16675 [Crocinitomicaceae bacterium]|nr:hypothetical protein [Crocinitomicaceae bacterium]